MGWIGGLEARGLVYKPPKRPSKPPTGYFHLVKTGENNNNLSSDRFPLILQGKPTHFFKATGGFLTPFVSPPSTAPPAQCSAQLAPFGATETAPKGGNGAGGLGTHCGATKIRRPLLEKNSMVSMAQAPPPPTQLVKSGSLSRFPPQLVPGSGVSALINGDSEAGRG